MNDTVKLLYSKKVAFIGTIFFLFLSLSTPYVIYQDKLNLGDSIPLIVVELIYLCAFFRSVVLLRKEKVMIELNKEEIICCSSNSTHYYKINWDNISEIRHLRIGIETIILIHLTDNKVVTSQTKNIFLKWEYFANTLFYGTPIAISPFNIEGKSSKIFETINTYFSEIEK